MSDIERLFSITSEEYYEAMRYYEEYQNELKELEEENNTDYLHNSTV